ncbi:MAG: BamA/TamA family outer membrane protein [Gemmatimonadota bacterium]|nr:BamA/TamA family outer membrane protein [Gemmatimonadota bacterium]
MSFVSARVRWALRSVVGAVAVTLLSAGAHPNAIGAQDLACDPGDREVRWLEFDGNRAFSDRELALKIYTSPSDVTRRATRILGRRRCLDSRVLRTDVLRLQTFYRTKGYYDAKVDTALTGLGSNSVGVTFRINEGQPVRIDSLVIAGLDSLSRDDRAAVLGAVGLRVGDVFDRDRLETAVRAIRTQLWNRGYPRADVLRDYRRDQRSASLELTVLPGRRARLGPIRVDVDTIESLRAGEVGHRTQIPAPVVLRIAGLRAGELYRERDLVAAQRNLYQTNAYRHVDVRLAPDSLQPPGDSIIVVEIELREDLMRQVDAQVGWATLDCFRVLTQYTDKNFLHGARRLELTAQTSKLGYGRPTGFARSLCHGNLGSDPFSQELHYFVGATLRQPAFLGTRFTPAFSLYRERRGEYVAYLRSTLIGGEASATRELRDGIPLRLAYTFEYGHTQAQPGMLCAVFNRCDSESRTAIEANLPLAVASAALARVRTDNQVSPTRGSVLRLELRNASRAIGSAADLQFNKGTIDGAWYRPVIGGTLAARLRLGAVVGTRLSFDDNVRFFVPPQERLYAGGATSVRGFQQNELGSVVYIARDPPEASVVDGVTVLQDTSGRVLRRVPVGGNSLIVGNLDYRFRTPLLPDLLQFSVFTDAGEVWNRGEDTRGFGFERLRWTPGIGVRVFSPVGPVQVNVAYNPYPNREGPLYYDAPFDPGTGTAPLYCVTPGNRLPFTGGSQAAGVCDANFSPNRPGNFFRRLTFTFSIGPDF